MVRQKIVKIIYNRQVKGNYFKLGLAFKELAEEAKPGQFIHVRVKDGFEPLLRRPFGVHRISGDKVEILYEVLGKGTQILSAKKAGENLDVLGPLGNGFNYTKTPVLVAGGMGVAPLLFLAEKLSQRKAQSAKRKILVLIGAKNKNHILCEEEFKKLGCEVKIATDDGSRGFKGKVTDLLKEMLRGTIYACGPRPMLKEIRKLCLAKHIPCQASFEENIACGLGACMGCAIKTAGGFKRVCLDGPVFEIGEVLI
jgi:dihydroorotate dehydrogenase electron transfer subunit